MVHLADLIVRAYETAHEFHRGQFRKDGCTPYIFHPVRVASAVEGAVPKAVALLHDVVEDSFPHSPAGVDAGISMLRSRGFPEQVVLAVDAMTQRKHDGERTRTGERYFDYIARVAQNTIARRVKMADLADNSGDLAEGDSLLKRYAKAKVMLEEAESAYVVDCLFGNRQV